MPCTYTGSIEGDRLLTMKDALDRRERMLCAVCTHLENVIGATGTASVLHAAALNADGLKPDEILEWWHQHKEKDAAKPA